MNVILNRPINDSMRFVWGIFGFLFTIARTRSQSTPYWGQLSDVTLFRVISLLRKDIHRWNIQVFISCVWLKSWSLSIFITFVLILQEALVLEAKINEQKQKQEKALQKRLKQKMGDREKSFLARQEMELEELAARESNGMAARLKRVALKHKHMVQMEEFR